MALHDSDQLTGFDSVSCCIGWSGLSGVAVVRLLHGRLLQTVRKVKDSEREWDFRPFVPWCLQESRGCVLGLDSDLKSTHDCKLSTWLEFSLHSNSCSTLAVLGMAITAWFLLVVTLFFLSQRILHRFMSFNFVRFKSAFIMNCDCTENLLLGK